MVDMHKLIYGTRHRSHTPRRHVLAGRRRTTHHNAIEEQPTGIDAKTVTLVAMRIKYLVEETIPCELDEDQITRPHSAIINNNVIELARNAGGDENKSCVIYCLLVCLEWFRWQSKKELYDADLGQLRAVACQILAKRIIESTDDQDYLFQELLVKRFSHLQNSERTDPMSAVERAVDLHALNVIGSSGYQKCIKYLWNGWIIQDELDPTQFVFYDKLTSVNYWNHVHPDRLKAPAYQNAFQILVSFIYLALYTAAINTVNPDGDIDIVEGILYVFTVGFIFDEAAKFWKVGRWYLGFWNVFNCILYTLMTTSFVLRCVALSEPIDTPDRTKYNILSYNFIAFSAPMFWCRVLLYLDSFRVFGAMLVILKQMFQETFIFFSLLIIIMVGFLQAFIGLDNTDAEEAPPMTGFIFRTMTNAILQSPEFDSFDKFSPPFGMILYYIFTFVIMVLLLNILIALFNSAYEDITGNATDEFMALFAQKTLQFVRAPDENVFLPPFNLIEVFFLVIPFEWWMDRKRYAKLNDRVLSVCYLPLLFISALVDTRNARHIAHNRAHGQPDDDEREEWEELDNHADFENSDWKEKVKNAVPNVEEDISTQEIKKVRKELQDLVDKIEKAGLLRVEVEDLLKEDTPEAIRAPDAE
ncbi:hypothetical protein TWF569_005174 [Orbilia oligospora]|uniref:Uncharacterized protein n=2 Tax=Orbilia oligospora TaxID=2813651 RepID=A0A7C8NSU0_ORBOL|nr:hypothetical protein TWF102_001365 [Orbilia oligospora]KAF3113609.1 hypothetical protein TWF103_001966 [Orbilia oligospora]KAF3134388.1 hypothetical protein TWF703_006370 [Orbilia oligospora]KAF3146996.1 hypothetical protein TWF594_003047 [Orbilia oligospora]KAF3149094.1 hypothetical protein TWF569_005174 [Orbilia oligospora]